MKEGHYFQDDENMLTDRHGVQLTDDERLVWLAAFGASATSAAQTGERERDRAHWCREQADTAVDLLRQQRPRKR